MNCSTTKARCSPDQAMVWTQNGMNRAVYRGTPHCSIPTPPLATPPPNRGVLSAAPLTRAESMLIWTLLCDISYEKKIEITFQNKLYNVPTTNKLDQKYNFRAHRTLLGKHKTHMHPTGCSLKMSSVFKCLRWEGSSQRHNVQFSTNRTSNSCNANGSN
jgi:hypothetical protein